MKNIKDFKGGWFVGSFTPSLLSRNDIEVGIKEIPEGTIGDGHYHKKASEYTLIIQGLAEDNGNIYTSGDIIILEPMKKNFTKFLKKSLILSIKSTSDTNDKYY